MEQISINNHCVRGHLVLMISKRGIDFFQSQHESRRPTHRHDAQDRDLHLSGVAATPRTRRLNSAPREFSLVAWR
jgi:hypothetical protein